MSKYYCSVSVDKGVSDLVLKSVAKFTHVQVKDVFEYKRKSDCVEAKRIYFYFMVNKFGCSSSSLERYFSWAEGVTYSNIIYHVRTCNNLRETDVAYNNLVERIESEIESEIIILNSKDKSGRSWIITRKNHRHNSYLLRRMK